VNKSSSVTLIFLYNGKRANSAAYRPPVERIPGYLPSAGQAALDGAGATPTVDTEGVAIEGEFAVHNRQHPDEPARMRISVQTRGDFLAKNAILTTRNAEEAQGGQILVLSLLKDLVASAGDIRLGEDRGV
jgi:hypothetical protein